MSSTNRKIPLPPQNTSIGGNVSSTGGNFVVGNNFLNSTVNLPSTQAQRSEIGEPVKVWLVPREVDKFFTGREDLLSRISRAFDGNGDHSAKQKRYVIAGLGGTGKSEVCLKYAWDNKDSYHKVFWVDCQTPDTAQNSFRQIGQRCGLGDAADVASVKSHIAHLSRGERWLLIIDNADDTEKNYRDYFPSTDAGHIILSARDSNLIEEYKTVGGEEIDLLNEDDAMKLLLKNAKIPQHEWLQNQEDANSIVKELGRHTLALVHAGSFIGGGRCKIEHYLKIYRAQHDILFNYKRPRSPSTYDTVHATFEVSVQFIHKLEKEGRRQDAKDALDILRILAFMAPECHLGLLLLDFVTFDRAQKTFQGDLVARLSDMTDSEILFAPLTNDPQQNMRWSEACALLGSLSIIKCYDENDLVSSGLSMHQLVHTWARHRLEEAEARCGWIQAAWIIGSIRASTTYTLLPSFLYVPSALFCLKSLQGSYVHNVRWFTGLLVLEVVRLLAEKGNFDLDQYLELAKQLLMWRGSVDPVNFNSAGDIDWTVAILELESRILYQKRSLSAGIKKFEMAIYAAKKLLGPTHAYTFELQRRLAGLYRETGQFQEALFSIDTVVNATKRAGYIDMMLQALLNRSSLLLDAGLLQKAKKELELIAAVNVLIMAADIMAADKSRCIATVCSGFLAIVNLYTRGAGDSKAIQDVVVESLKAMKGEDKYTTLDTQMQFGKLALESENWDLAIDNFKSAVKTTRESFPLYHRTRVYCEESLALAREGKARGHVLTPE